MPREIKEIQSTLPDNKDGIDSFLFVGIVIGFAFGILVALIISIYVPC